MLIWVSNVLGLGDTNIDSNLISRPETQISSESRKPIIESFSQGFLHLSCNWLGGHASVLAMDWFGSQTLANTPFTNMTINGAPVAAIQNVANFSFAWVWIRILVVPFWNGSARRVYQAGHEVVSRSHLRTRQFNSNGVPVAGLPATSCLWNIQADYQYGAAAFGRGIGKIRCKTKEWASPKWRDMGVAAYFILLGCMIMGEHRVKIAGYPKVEIKLPFTASR